MDFPKLRSLVSDHKTLMGVVAVVVVLLAWLYMRDRNSPAHNIVEPAPQNLANDDKDSADALFDPTDERTDAKYKMPVKLSAPEVQQLAADNACAKDYYMLWFGLAVGYSEIYDHLQEESDAIADRISTGKGFKNDQIPARWRQIIDSGQNPGEFAATAGMYQVLQLRFESVNHNLIGGECKFGDVYFVKWISNLALSRIAVCGARLKSADELQHWLEEEDLKDKFYAKETGLKAHPDLQKVINDIYASHNKAGGTPPKLEFPK